MQALFVLGACFSLKGEPKMKQILQKESTEFTTLLRSIPSHIVTLFVLSVVLMNLLANKSINMPISWLALDCGILLSWLSFLTMDIITKHYGPKAAIQIAIFAMFVNLLTAAMFYLASIIPGTWGESYVEGAESTINSALDHTIGGTWYVLLGSTIAFLVSAIINNILNWAIGKTMKKDNIPAFLVRTYVSTLIGQFIDNLVFALLVSHFFFGWTIVQCLTCALTGAIVELLFEVVFSPIGYHVTKKWKRENIGKEYFVIIQKEKKENE